MVKPPPRTAPAASLPAFSEDNLTQFTQRVETAETFLSQEDTAGASLHLRELARQVTEEPPEWLTEGFARGLLLHLAQLMRQAGLDDTPVAQLCGMAGTREELEEVALCGAMASLRCMLDQANEALADESRAQEAVDMMREILRSMDEMPWMCEQGRARAGALAMLAKGLLLARRMGEFAETVVEAWPLVCEHFEKDEGPRASMEDAVKMYPQALLGGEFRALFDRAHDEYEKRNWATAALLFEMALERTARLTPVQLRLCPIVGLCRGLLGKCREELGDLPAAVELTRQWVEYMENMVDASAPGREQGVKHRRERLSLLEERLARQEEGEKEKE